MSAFVGDFMIGVQELWPANAVSASDFFDRPTWERPTDDNPDDGSLGGGPDDFSGEGSGGFGGGSHGGYGGGSSGGFGGGVGGGGFYWWDYGGGGAGDGGTLVIVNADGTVTRIEIAANRRKFYRIEVYDEDGDRLSEITEWTSGKLKRVLDTASTLEFTVPASAAGVADLVRPNTVWLRDRWGFVVDTFQIQRRKPRGAGDASYLDFVCQGKITQLAGEVVLEYNGADIPVIDHVAALLDLQVKTDVITLGTIDSEIADIALPFYAYDTNIHAALLQLQLALPQAQRGRMYLDPQGRLQWRMAPGDATEQVITRALNIRSIEAETDYDAIVNRLYMYGDGQDRADRLNLVDAGEAQQYLEDAASVATWGLHPFIKVDRRIRYPETLVRVAERILEEFSEPPTTVRVDLLDIAKADDAPVGFADIHIGGRYRVVDTDLGLDSSIEIVAIESDLARPVPIRVDLANQTRTLSDFISDIVDALQQPLDVDGDRYPTMGRNYSERDARDPRAGDVRWNDGSGGGDPRGQMHDGDDWQDVGDGDELHYVASTKAGLTAASGVDVRSLGRVDGGGADNGMVAVPNPAKTGWDALNFWE